MRLRALTAGYAVPCVDFEASLHSVFRTAVNLRPARQSLLLTLVAAAGADLPQGIRLATPGNFSFEHLSAGSRVFCRDGSLLIEASNLQVDLRHCRQWQCELPALATDLSNPRVAGAWKLAWKVLNERQVELGAEIMAERLFHPGGNAPSAVSRKLGEAVRELLLAIRNPHVNHPAALTRLIGLGSGLTPSGDDFLAGYLAGLWCTVRESVERRRLISELGQAVIHVSVKTNDISRTYLQHAAHAQVSSRLEALAAAISTAQGPAQVLPAAESAMQAGHTSGMDAVTGLLCGLATWEGEAYLAGA